MEAIVVKIIRIGQRTEEVALAAGATVQEALNTAEIDVPGSSFRFNGIEVNANSRLNESGDLVITKQIAGA